MLLVFATVLSMGLVGQDSPKPDALQTGRATMLRSALKYHAAFLGAEAGRITLRPDGSADAQSWPVDPDAEIRIQGHWGGLEDLDRGGTIWVWTRIGPDGKARAVFMVADEISEQDIHQVPYTVTAVDPERRTVDVRRKLDGKNEQTRVLKAAADLKLPEKDTRVYVQTAGEELVRSVDADGLAKLKEVRRARLEDRWRKNGLPGTVIGLHLLSGEIELALDHEALRWGRALKPGDRSTLQLGKPLPVLVQEVRPWYERTRVILVSNGRDLADVAPGRRVRLGVSEPAAELLASRFPPDSERPREAGARAEWMLASVYCGCTISGDVCTGMFYTLAACNTMTCGMPNQVRAFVRPLIEKGLTDREIFGRMEIEFGPSLWKPHLLR